MSLHTPEGRAAAIERLQQIVDELARAKRFDEMFARAAALRRAVVELDRVIDRLEGTLPFRPDHEPMIEVGQARRKVADELYAVVVWLNDSANRPAGLGGVDIVDIEGEVRIWPLDECGVPIDKDPIVVPAPTVG